MSYTHHARGSLRASYADASIAARRIEDICKGSAEIDPAKVQELQSIAAAFRENAQKLLGLLDARDQNLKQRI